MSGWYWKSRTRFIYCAGLSFRNYLLGDLFFVKGRWRLCTKCNFQTQQLMGFNRKQYTIICRADGEPGFNLYEGVQCCANEEGCAIALMVICSYNTDISRQLMADLQDVYLVIVLQIYSSRALSWYVCLEKNLQDLAIFANTVFFWCIGISFLLSPIFCTWKVCHFMPSNIQNLFFSFTREEVVQEAVAII